MVSTLESAYRKLMRLVSVWRINILPQMRKSFDQKEQDELTESIRKKGVLNAPIVALFTLAELRQYLKVINKLWKSSIAAEDLKSSKIKGQRLYFVLLAGERRLRSLRPLVREGKQSRLLKVIIHEHLDPLSAIDIQFSENCHRRVPPHEEAYAYGEYWELISAKYGEPPTLSGFAKRVGRSPAAIKAALQFVSLPATIRHAVAGEWGMGVPNAKLFRRENLRLPYSIAVELARLSERGKTEHYLIDLMVGAVLGRTKVEKFHEQVNQILNNDTPDLPGLMTENAIEAERRAHFRLTVEKGVNWILCGWESWLARVLVLFEKGLLGKDDSPFADGSVKNRIANILALLEKIFQLFYKQPSLAARQRIVKAHEMVEELKRTA